MAKQKREKILKKTHLSYSPVVSADKVADTCILEWHVLATIYMANARAWCIHHASMTLPNLNGMRLTAKITAKYGYSYCSKFWLTLKKLQEAVGIQPNVDLKSSS